MSRPRIKPYTDIVLSQQEADKIQQGYRISHMVNKHIHCIYVNKANKQIEALRSIIDKASKKLSKLEGNGHAKHFGRTRRQDANGKWHWYLADGTPVTKGVQSV